MKDGRKLPFKERLKIERVSRGWSQQNVAEKLGTNAKVVSTWERGLHLPTPHFRPLLCDLFEMTLEELGLLDLLPPIFLLYADANEACANRLKKELRSLQVNIWEGKEGELDIRAWGDALQKTSQQVQTIAIILIASPDAHSSPSVRERLEIAQLYECPVYAFWIAGKRRKDTLPANYQTVASFIDAREARYETALNELYAKLDALLSMSNKMEETSSEPRNPYKGLLPFTQDDADAFFGRDQLLDELADALEEMLTQAEKGYETTRLLAVIGPSGSGKTSLVMAGLLPRLQAGELIGSKDWIYLQPLVPGYHPLEALAETFGDSFPEKSLISIREDLSASNKRGLHMLATQLAQGTGVKVVLVVDQFEELFTQTTDEDERKQFIDLLVIACTELDGPVLVILTLRADFYDRPMYYRRLGEIIEQQSKSVLPMEIRELKAVIREPARLPDVQVTFDEKLVAGLLYEAPERENALPLLEFTLLQLFQRRSEHRLTLQAYHEMGGVKGALIQHAEDTYAALPSEKHRELARALFVRLIDPGATEQETTRRRAPYSEFALDDDTQNHLLKETMRAFIKARLLTTKEGRVPSSMTNEVTRITTIEVSHEVLIREWRRLANWLHEAREDIPLQQAISKDVTAWMARDKPRERLYRGSQLREAKGWAKRNLPSRSEMAFLGESAARQRHSRLGMATLALAVLLPMLFIAQLLLPKPPSFPICTLITASSPTEPVVYVGSGGGKSNFVYALQASNGHQLWHCQAGNSVYSSPKLVKGIIYVGSKDTNVYAFRATNGSLLWHFTTKDIVQSSPDVTNGVVFIGSNDGNVYGLRANDGSLLWRYQASAAVLSSPVVMDGIVYIASFDGNVYALRASDGHLIWRYPIGKKKIITSSPAVVNGAVYISVDDSTVYALAVSNGHLLWKHLLGTVQLALGVGASSAPFDSSPAVEDGTLYVGSRDGSIYALRAKNGSLLWSYQTGASIYSSPAVVGGLVYIGSGDNFVYALQASDGHLKWKYQTGGHVISLPMIG